MYDTVQITGSLLILAAFVLAQAGRINQTSLGYLVANAGGSTALTGTAVISREWGFIMLEGVWALVSLAGIVRVGAGRRRSASPA